MAARQVHMFCAYWGFAVMSVHIGMHWNMAVTMAGKLFKEPSVLRKWGARLIALVVAGYGTRETSGYSIKVNDVYTGDNALYIDLNLIGPAAGEAVNEVDTYPVIVLKMERREESVVFKM